MEDVLAQARDAEAASEEFLVDDGWKVVEVEPEAVEVNGNGTNGHHADGIGPTVELVLANGHHANGNGHAPAPVNGNGHSDEAPEPQQSLFSWAEFMAEEPVKAEGPGPQASARSHVPVRVGTGKMEQEREAEPVGQGARPDAKGEGIAPLAMPSPCWSCMRPFLRFSPLGSCVRPFSFAHFPVGH